MKRRKPGRPKNNTKRYQVRLDPPTRAKAKRIGKGKVSPGLRIAVAAYDETGGAK